MRDLKIKEVEIIMGGSENGGSGQSGTGTGHGSSRHEGINELPNPDIIPEPCYPGPVARPMNGKSGED